MEIERFLSEEGKVLKPLSFPLSDEELLKGYLAMVKTRHVDERMLTLQRQGVISFAMSSKGEEACAVASAQALKPDDWMYPQYRESGILFFRGFSIQDFVHQMFGDAKDLILGRQMPNHFGSRALNVVPVSSPIGTKIPHAAGAAYGMKLKEKDEVAIVYFGDGATSEGDFHAGVNFAAVTKAPVIFFCRNNSYAISTPCTAQFACKEIASKGIGYGIDAYRIDGNDYFSIFETVSLARKRCLEGRGPQLIEAVTYRMGAHSTSDDPSLYRLQEEVDPWEKKSPISRVYSYLSAQGLWDATKEETYLKEIADEVTQAIQIAKETPAPPPESMMQHVYFEMPEELEIELAKMKEAAKWLS